MNNRLVAADILEHFLYLVPTDKQKFFQNAIEAVRRFGNGDADYRRVNRFHKVAERRHDVVDLTYLLMLSALVSLTSPEEPLQEFEQFALVRVNCLDATYNNRSEGGKEGEAREWIERKLEEAREVVA